MPQGVESLMRAMAEGQLSEALNGLAVEPSLAAQALKEGATRQQPTAYFLKPLGRYLYEGDTPLHIAAAAWSVEAMRALLAAGASPMARNRRGATPLHDAATGDPNSPRWDPDAQAKAIGALIEAGADANARDENGATPLQKAVRTRCARAVEALLTAGADPSVRTKNGSTAYALAKLSSGRGGSGSPEARAQRAEILLLLEGGA